MVVTVAAGLRGADVDRLAVTRVEVKDKTMTVFYRLSVGPGAAGSATRPRRCCWTASTARSTPRKTPPPHPPPPAGGGKGGGSRPKSRAGHVARRFDSSPLRNGKETPMRYTLFPGLLAVVGGAPAGRGSSGAVVSVSAASRRRPWLYPGDPPPVPLPPGAAVVERPPTLEEFACSFHPAPGTL